MIDHKHISQRKACRWMGLSRNALVEPVAIKEKDQPLRNQIEQLARRYKHWGVLKIYRRLRKQGELVNHKRIRRLYKSLGLSLHRKTKKRLPDAVRKPLPKATACNQCWSLDFTSDNLTGGRKFRTLNVVDDYNREAPGMEVDYSLPAQRVIRLLDQLVGRCGKPERLRSDNGPRGGRQSLLAKLCRIGARVRRLSYVGSSRANLLRMPTLNGSTGRFGEKY